jgi:rRNA maturation endonuclease Nob1
MEDLYEELRNKIDSSDTEELTKIQEEVVKEKNNGNITGDEAHRLKEAIDRRLGGFNL